MRGYVLYEYDTQYACMGSIGLKAGKQPFRNGIPKKGWEAYHRGFCDDAVLIWGFGGRKDGRTHDERSSRV